MRFTLQLNFIKHRYMDLHVFSQEYVDALNIPNIIVYAAPIMIGLVLLEWAVSVYKKKDYYDGKDVLAATTVGLVNVGLNALTKVFTFGLMLLVNLWAPIRIEPTWWSFVLCLVAFDFFRYWAHRLAHENRWLWATHVTHHNGPKYNWSVSFRLSWTQQIKVLFFLPVAFMGFHPFVLFICHQIEVLYQFWIHTEYIKKLPKPIEYIFTTPSHHRVHHAKNDKYLDKNYGSTFIIWDRMFGTFQPEEADLKPEYGITKNFLSYNPVTLNFHEWSDMFKDMRKTKSLKSAWRIAWQRPSEIEKNPIR